MSFVNDVALSLRNSTFLDFNWKSEYYDIFLLLECEFNHDSLVYAGPVEFSMSRTILSVFHISSKANSQLALAEGRQGCQRSRCWHCKSRRSKLTFTCQKILLLKFNTCLSRGITHFQPG